MSRPSEETEDTGTRVPVGDNAAKALRSFAERIERLEEEKKALASDIREVYGEVKAQGFDAKVLRKVLMLRKMDPNDREELESMVDLYMDAIGVSHGDTIA